MGQNDDDQTHQELANGTSNERNAELARLKVHIVNLERELLNYGIKYGLTDRARELLADLDVD